MAKIDSRALIQEFYNTIKNDYPHLELSQVNHICRSPWIFLKAHMQTLDFDSMRLQYLGIFRVYPKKAEHVLKKLQAKFLEHKISPEYYFPIKKGLEQHVKRYTDVDTPKTDNQ